MAAANHRATGVPTCCGQIIPKSAYEAAGVLSDESNGRNSYKTSEVSEIDAIGARPPLSTTQTQLQISKQRHTTVPDGSDVMAAQESYKNLAKAVEIQNFRSMREAQEYQRDRCLAWEIKHLEQIQAIYIKRKEEVNVTFDEERDALEEQVGSDRTR